MHRILQLICYVGTLVCVLIIGGVLGTLSWQSRDYWSMVLNGRPLPRATNFIAAHYGICGSLAFLPWLGFIGLPLLPSTAGKSYWDTHSFLLRFATFAVTELAFVMLVLLAILAPAAGMMKSMPSISNSILEPALRGLVWLNIAIFAGLAAVRIWQWKKSRSGLRDFK